MEIKFEKRYPDLSNVAMLSDLTKSDYGRIFISLWLNELPANSTIVYASPSRGEGLLSLAPLLVNHKVVLIEDYSMREVGETIKDKQSLLRKAIELSQLNNILLKEGDFVNVWPTLAHVDFLLLDGPPTTVNFKPFSNKFIYMMHDINQRLQPFYYEHLDVSDPYMSRLIHIWTFSLDPYMDVLCRADDSCQFEGTDEMLHPALKVYRDIDKESQLYKEYGPHGWLTGEKITD